MRNAIKRVTTGSFYFDGISSYISIPNSGTNPLFNTNIFTVEVRFSPAALSGMVISKWEWDHDFFLSFENSQGQLVFKINSVQRDNVYSTTNCVVGGQYHVVVTRDLNYMYMYVNGQLEDTEAINSTTRFLCAHDMNIGRSNPNANATDGSGYFKGFITLAAYYSDTWSAAMVTERFNNPNSDIVPPNCTFLYNDKNISNPILDRSGNGFNGELHNMAASGTRIRNARNLIGGGVGWQDNPAIYTPKSGTDIHPSIVELSDGRLLYMYSRVDVLYQCYYPNLAAFLQNDSGGITEQVVLDGYIKPRATMFRDPNGDLFFMVVRLNITAVPNYGEVVLYKSNLKDGSDWELYSTVVPPLLCDDADRLYAAEYLPISAPYFLGNLWVMSYPHLYLSYGYLEAVLQIGTSSDNGRTWTSRKVGNSKNIESATRNFAMFNGELWWCYAHAYLNVTVKFYKSTDGINWQLAFDYLGNSSTQEITLYSDSQYLYALTGGPTKVYRTSITPSSFSDFQIIPNMSINMVTGSQYNCNTLFTPIQDKLILMSAYADTKVTCLNKVPIGIRCRALKPLLSGGFGGVTL